MATPRPAAIYILIVILIIQAISGLGGGIALIAAPSGALLQMPTTVLHIPIFKNFLLPGLALAILLGVFPLVVAISLLFRPSYNWANYINIIKAQHWAHTFSIYVGIMLVVFINVELIVTETYLFLQPVYSFIGLLIIILALLPSVATYYKADK